MSRAVSKYTPACIVFSFVLLSYKTVSISNPLLYSFLEEKPYKIKNSIDLLVINVLRLKMRSITLEMGESYCLKFLDVPLKLVHDVDITRHCLLKTRSIMVNHRKQVAIFLLKFVTLTDSLTFKEYTAG